MIKIITIFSNKKIRFLYQNNTLYTSFIFHNPCFSKLKRKRRQLSNVTDFLLLRKLGIKEKEACSNCVANFREFSYIYSNKLLTFKTLP